MQRIWIGIAAMAETLRSGSLQYPCTVNATVIVIGKILCSVDGMIAFWDCTTFLSMGLVKNPVHACILKDLAHDNRHQLV
jgi:hypothetical protein